jgi:hypothetical protein
MITRCNCKKYKIKIIELYNKIEKTIYDPNKFIPISGHNKLIRSICNIEKLWICYDTENCKDCIEINDKRLQIIDIGGTQIKLFTWCNRQKII